MPTLLIKNAIYNVIRLGSGAVIALFLPPMLVHSLNADLYAVWIIVTQLSNYVNYLDFGIQTAVGRSVAQTTDLVNYPLRNKTVSTAIALLSVGAALGILLTLVLAWQLPALFVQMNPALRQLARISLIISGLGLAIGLPFSTFSGIFIGLQRNEIPALVISGSKLLGAGLIVFVAKTSGNIVGMSVVWTLSLLGAGILQGIISHRQNPMIRVSVADFDKDTAQQILRYCFSLTVWTLATLLISGIDTLVVGYFDFESVPFYAVASSLVLFISGLQNALFGALMPRAAIMGTRNDRIGLTMLLVQGTRYGMIILLLTGLPMILFARQILNVWLGTEFAANSSLILQILVVANIVRLSATPYATLLIGTGQQRLMLVSPIVEALVNLVVSVSMGALLGPIGVAIGTLVGAFVAILLNVVYNLPRTQGLDIKISTYLTGSIFRPLICSVPCLSVLIPWQNNIGKILIDCVALITSVYLLWSFGLLSSERSSLMRIIQKRLKVHFV